MSASFEIFHHLTIYSYIRPKGGNFFYTKEFFVWQVFDNDPINDSRAHLNSTVSGCHGGLVV